MFDISHEDTPQIEWESRNFSQCVELSVEQAIRIERKDSETSQPLRIGKLHHNIHRIVIGILKRFTAHRKDAHDAVREAISMIRLAQNTKKIRGNQANISRVLLFLKANRLDPIQILQAINQDLKLVPKIENYDIEQSQKIKKYFEEVVLRAATNLDLLSQNKLELSDSDLKLVWRKAFQQKPDYQ